MTGRAPLLLTLALVMACNQPERAADSVALDPRRSIPIVEVLPVPLDPIVLVSHEDYDRWEDEVIERSGATLAYMLYKDALVNRRGTQRTFVRWVALSYREELSEDYREPLQQFVKGFAEAEQLAPDVRYLMGFMAWKRLTGVNGPDVATNLSRAAHVDTVITNWTKLAEEAPDWTGPRGTAVHDLTRRVAALKRSLEEQAPKPESDPTPAESSPDTLGGRLATRIAGVYSGVSNRPPWSRRAATLRQTVVDLELAYEEGDRARSCAKLSEAFARVRDLPSLGVMSAHCAIDRNKPLIAIAQLRRLVALRAEWGLAAPIVRLGRLALDDPAVSVELARLVAEARVAAEADPRWGHRSGFRDWLARQSRPAAP